MKHKSDLRHASTAKAQTEDKEKKAREGLRVIEGELRVVREELEIARDELCNKAALLDQECREAFEAESSIERLKKKCSALRRAARAFPSLDFNFQVPSEEKAKESSFESEVDPRTFSDAPHSADCPGDPEVPAKASSPSLLVEALSSVQSPASDV